MNSLTSKERSFVAMMARSDEHARKGFELILKRPDFAKFFDTLIERGFFDSSKNPAPVPVQPDGHVRIPYWKALDYLKACATMSGQVGNADLADRVMAIVRAVSTGSKCADSRDNHLTFWAFAEIIGLLPIASIASHDLGFVQVWLDTKYDRSLVAHALDEALTSFLKSDDPTVWRKAVQLLRYCTAIRWKSSQLDPETEEPATVADEYYVKEMIDHHAASLGKNVGHEAAKLLAGRVAEVFGRGGRAKWSHVFRPAVEDDDQNVKGVSVDCIVEGLRDVLLGWCDDDVRAAKPFVKCLLDDQNEMLRRIGIFVVNRRWTNLKELYLPVVSPGLFDFGHLHELYLLLRDRFETFSDEEKEATVEAIRGISEPNTDANGARELAQCHWLSAVAGTSYEPASKWLAELTDKHGPVGEHPEYLSFDEMRWGHGPSRYSAEELIALADDGTIVEKLRAFRPGDPWYGPTARSLIDEIQRAVEAAPDRFIPVLPDLLEAPRPYQYALLQGFWRLLSNLGRGVKTTTPTVLWDPLFNFLEQLLRDPGRCVTGRSNSQEVPPSSICDAISDLILSGTRDGTGAYPACLLPRAWSLIEVLVERGESIAEPSEEPMRQTINSSKGRALDAAFSHILRRFRNFDETPDSHASVWTEVRPFLDRQLDRCAGTNFEFSTLCGTHIRNLQFLDAGWLNERVQDIFPVKYPGNFRSALAGLAYATVNRTIYRMLRDTGIMDGALRLELKSRYSREKLLETLALAYLWGDEALTSPRFEYLFASQRTEDFESINHFLPTTRDSSLDPEQAERVADYWRRCVDWARSLSETPANLLSSLSGLTVFLTAADGNLDLLIPVAAHVHVHRNAHGFILELNRLVKVSPCGVRTVLAKFIETHEPFYDYKNGMQTLVRALAEHGFREDAIDFCNKLRSMPTMEALYNELMP